MERVAKHWHGLPKDVAESPSLEDFKKHVDIAVREISNDRASSMLELHSFAAN